MNSALHSVQLQWLRCCSRMHIRPSDCAVVIAGDRLGNDASFVGRRIKASFRIRARSANPNPNAPVGDAPPEAEPQRSLFLQRGRHVCGHQDQGRQSREPAQEESVPASVSAAELGRAVVALQNLSRCSHSPSDESKSETII